VLPVNKGLCVSLLNLAQCMMHEHKEMNMKDMSKKSRKKLDNNTIVGT